MFSVGEKVQWTNVSQKGHIITMLRREGRVIAVSGGTLTVRRGKSIYELQAENVRYVDQRSELSDFVEAVFAANRSKDDGE